MRSFKLTAEEQSSGFVLIKVDAVNPDFERQMSEAEAIMFEDREILRALAK